MKNKIIQKLKKWYNIQERGRMMKLYFPYLVCFYLGNIISAHIQSYVGGDVFDRIFQGILEIDKMRYRVSIDWMDINVGVVFAT